MKIWLETKSDIDKYERWVKKEASLALMTSDAELQQEDYVASKCFDKYPECIDLQSEFDKALTNVMQEFRYNYNYYALKNAIQSAKYNNIDTLITGSSYALFGYDKSEIANSVGLGLHAQDLYYTSLGVYDVCTSNNNIRDIVVICGPYYFYSDLSKTRNITEIRRVSRVYKPLFNDVHNCLLLEPKMEILCDSCIWDMQKILDIYSMSEYEKGFFNPDHPRNRYATKTWDRDCDWLDLSENEKWEAGAKRAKAHNNNIKHLKTLAENRIHLQRLVGYCESKGIKLSFVVAPASKYYRKEFNTEFISSFYDVLNCIESDIHLLDLFECEDFLDEDYNDSDHLSESGAKKLSKIISTCLLQ